MARAGIINRPRITHIDDNHNVFGVLEAMKFGLVRMKGKKAKRFVYWGRTYALAIVQQQKVCELFLECFGSRSFRAYRNASDKAVAQYKKGVERLYNELMEQLESYAKGLGECEAYTERLIKELKGLQPTKCLYQMNIQRL